MLVREELPAASSETHQAKPQWHVGITPAATPQIVPTRNLQRPTEQFSEGPTEEGVVVRLSSLQGNTVQT